MANIIKTVLDQILNLKFLTNYRTTVVGGLIVLLSVYQALAGDKALDPATYAVVNGLLIERLAKFAKEHKG